MSVDETVSDKLVDTRERLRREYNEFNQIPIRDIKTPPPKLAERIAVPQRTELDRDCRELEGRLLSSLATVIAELEEIDFRREKLAKCKDDLQNICDELQIVAGNGSNQQEIERLRLNFFRASGVVPSAGISLPQIEEKNTGKEFKTFPVVIAIICSALIIAGAMLICFI